MRVQINCATWQKGNNPYVCAPYLTVTHNQMLSEVTIFPGEGEHLLCGAGDSLPGPGGGGGQVQPAAHGRLQVIITMIIMIMIMMMIMVARAVWPCPGWGATPSPWRRSRWPGSCCPATPWSGARTQIYFLCIEIFFNLYCLNCVNITLPLHLGMPGS